jgi:aryl-alcohol dehydrogenase-like predicted oxidoreductase
MMHRDDPAIPAGEFVDAIAREVTAGRIASYGFSNWTLSRVEQAIAHADRQSIPHPSAVSNNFSLAEMIEPVWAGCVTANTGTWRKRLAAGDLGLYAWSSQARGFFFGDSADDFPQNPEIAGCWSSERNLERRRRAFELAAQHGKTANQAALAWCLHQNVPLVPLIGPLTRAELASSLEALDIALSESDVRWLDA